MVDELMMGEIKEYSIDCCWFFNEARKAAIQYAVWSAAPEYRMIGAAGVKVHKISNKDLEPYLGRGMMPLLEDTTLVELLKKRDGDIPMVLAAWSQCDPDVYDAELYSLAAAVLKDAPLNTATERSSSRAKEGH